MYLAHGMVAVVAMVVLVFPSCSMSCDCTAHDDLRSTEYITDLSAIGSDGHLGLIQAHHATVRFFQWQSHGDSASILESFVLTGLIDMV